MRRLIAIVLLVAGCATVPAPRLPEGLAAFPKILPRYDGIRLTPELNGRLVLDNGCLRIVTPVSSQMAVWYPEAVVVGGDGGEPLRVVDTTTGFGASPGDHVRGGAGSSGVWTDPRRLDSPIPAACPGPYVAPYSIHVAPGPDWTTFRARGPYSLRRPPGVVEVAMTPIDSAADHLVSDRLRFNLDYGRYGCGVLHRNPGERHLVSEDFVGGHRAQVDRYSAEPNEIGEFGERIYAQVPHLDAAGNCLAIHVQCRTARDCDIAYGMIQSIRFDADSQG